MRGKVIGDRHSSAETMISARDLYEQALKVEPENIDALAGIATTLVFEVLNGYYGAGNEQRLHQAEAAGYPIFVPKARARRRSML